MNILELQKEENNRAEICALDWLDDKFGRYSSDKQKRKMREYVMDSSLLEKNHSKELFELIFEEYQGVSYKDLIFYITVYLDHIYTLLGGKSIEEESPEKVLSSKADIYKVEYEEQQNNQQEEGS